MLDCCRLAAAAPPAALARAMKPRNTQPRTHSAQPCAWQHAATEQLASCCLGCCRAAWHRSQLLLVCVATPRATRNGSAVARQSSADVTHAQLKAVQRWSGRRESGHNECTSVPVVAVSSSGSSRNCSSSSFRKRRVASAWRELSTVSVPWRQKGTPAHRDAHKRRVANAALAPPRKHRLQCSSLARASAHRSVPARRTRPARQQRAPVRAATRAAAACEQASGGAKTTEAVAQARGAPRTCVDG